MLQNRMEIWFKVAPEKPPEANKKEMSLDYYEETILF
jgi:hypothetical protein